MKADRKTVTPALVLIACLLSLSAAAGASVPGRDYREGEILVKYRSSAGNWERSRVRDRVGALKGRSFRRLGMEKLTLGEGLTAAEAVDLLREGPGVEYAELNYYVAFLDAPRVEPDDPGFTSGDQWYLDARPVQGFHITPGNIVSIDRDLDAPEAWAVMGAAFASTMAASVGVLDSGVGEEGFFSLPTGYLPNHEDLDNSMLWRNTKEAAGVPDSDDDLNGFDDDFNGWDHIGSDNAPADEFDPAAPYHGTHISGIIAGLWGNGVGVAGIGRGQLRVQPHRISTIADIVAAIDYAIEAPGTPPVVVLNASWKFNLPLASLEDAVIQAGKAGIAIVAAAGNDGNNNDINTGFFRVYPAEYTKVPLDNLLAVGATGLDGSLASFSNYGPGSVQVAGPGVGIYSPDEGTGGADAYSFVSGTSFSTPIAAAALGLVMAANPGMSPSEAIDRVIKGGDFDARLSGLVASGRRVNLAGALAPFAPYSGLAPMDTLTPISLYADTLSALYGSISAAFSDSPSVAVMVTTPGGAWAVSPVSPGLANFSIEFDGLSAPVGTYGTGLWRVTGISPFSAGLLPGQSMSFRSLVSGGTIDWSVTDSTVGTIDSGGSFSALRFGTTRVVLNVDGRDVDNSGTVLVIAPDADGDHYREGNRYGEVVDCNDTDPDINPRAREVCSDQIDNDCDGLIDGMDPECSNGGCATAEPPADEPMWPVMAVMAGMVALLVRRSFWKAYVKIKSKI